MMKFCEAIEKLKSGSKITRTPWMENVYFLLDGSELKSFQPMLDLYVYDENIMVSEGWIGEGQDKEMNFCEVVPLLKQGSKVKMKHWSRDSYIYFDSSTQQLVIHTMNVLPFAPKFQDFMAEDWIEIN